MTHIIVDGTCDMNRHTADLLRITTIPLHVFFGTDEYIDGVTLSKKEFFSMLEEAKTLPTTAQVNPDTFAEAFRNHLAREDDEIVCLCVSSKLSGTYQSAVIAAEMVAPERIHVVDSRSVTFGLALLAMKAADMRDEGLPAAQIAEEIKALRKKVRVYAALSTLKYLKMGGRISAATAMVGGLMGILPIVSVQNGQVESIGKVRGKAALLPYLSELVSKDDMDEDSIIAFGHANDPDALRSIRDHFDTLAKKHQVYFASIGCVVGTFTGSGACGLAYFVK